MIGVMRGKGRRGVAFASLLLLFMSVGSHALAAEVKAKVMGAAEGVASSWLTAVTPAGDGSFWVGTGDMGLFRLDPNGVVKDSYKARANGLASNEVTSLAVYGGRLYAGTSAGLSILDDGKWSTLSSAADRSMRNVRVAASPDGKELWAASMTLDGGVVRFDGASWAFMGGEGRGLFNDVNSFAFDASGAVIMGSQLGAVYVRKGVDVTSLQAELPSSAVYAVAERGGSIYAGTGKGLFVWRGDRWYEMEVPAPFVGRPVYSLVRSELDIVAGSLAGVLVLDGKGVTRSAFEGTQVVPGMVRAVAVSGNALAAAAEKGVLVVTGWRN